MPRSKGIHRHTQFKLGKAPAKHDERTLRFAILLKAKISLPRQYDFDAQHPDIPLPMFANDRYGDCVMAGRAHQTLRFELAEQKQLINITDLDVTREYFQETGGADTGLIVLDSLRLWRTSGWRIDNTIYKIQAFSELDPKNRDLIKQAIVLDIGVGLGIGLPLSAQRQFEAGKAWDVVRGPGAAVNSWGGHYVFVPGYTPTGPVCVTWGRKQQITWRFLEKYCDEAYAIIDALDSPSIQNNLHADRVQQFLDELS